jgi:hypothetical protein
MPRQTITMKLVQENGLQRGERKKETIQDPLDSRFGTLQSSESRVTREDRPLMNQCKIPQEVNNDICEAAGCFSPTEVQLKVKVGQLGTILLSLCKNCVSKF